MTSSRKLDNEQVLGLTLNQAKMRGPVNINCFALRLGGITGQYPEFK